MLVTQVSEQIPSSFTYYSVLRNPIKKSAISGGDSVSREYIRETSLNLSKCSC